MFSHKILGLILVFLPSAVVFAKSDNLEDLRAAFQQGKLGREPYLDRLTALWFHDLWTFRESDVLNRKMSSLDAEMKKHLLPSNSNSQSLTDIMVGKWDSPRHSYLYRANLTWTMLPEDDLTTHGLWKIKGNRLYDSEPAYSSKIYTQYIILLDAKYFVATIDGKVFYERRVK